MRTGTVILVVAVLALVCLANSVEAGKKQKSSKVQKSSGNEKREASAVKSKSKSKSANKYSKSANSKEGKAADSKTKEQGKPGKEQKYAKVKKVKRSAEEVAPAAAAAATTGEEAETRPETRCECPPARECVCEKCAAAQAAEADSLDAAVVAEEEETAPVCEATIDAGLCCEHSCACTQGTVCFASSIDATQGICKIPEPEDLDMGVYLS